jgi:hypothetical protein
MRSGIPSVGQVSQVLPVKINMELYKRNSVPARSLNIGCAESIMASLHVTSRRRITGGRCCCCCCCEVLGLSRNRVGLSYEQKHTSMCLMWEQVKIFEEKNAVWRHWSFLGLFIWIPECAMIYQSQTTRIKHGRGRLAWLVALAGWYRLCRYLFSEPHPRFFVSSSPPKLTDPCSSSMLGGGGVNRMETVRFIVSWYLAWSVITHRISQSQCNSFSSCN